MRICSILDLGSTVRGKRLELRLSQAELARRSGVSRKWLSEFERGKPGAEVFLVLSVLEAAGLALYVDDDTERCVLG